MENDIVQEWLDVTSKIIAASNDKQKMRKALITYIELNIIIEEDKQEIVKITNNIEQRENQ